MLFDDPWFGDCVREGIVKCSQTMSKVLVMERRKALIIPEKRFLLSEGQSLIQVKVFVPLTDVHAHVLWQRGNEHLS